MSVSVTHDEVSQEEKSKYHILVHICGTDGLISKTSWRLHHFPGRGTASSVLQVGIRRLWGCGVEVGGACLVLDTKEWEEQETWVPPVTPERWVSCHSSVKQWVQIANQTAHSKCWVYISHVSTVSCWNA